MSTTSNLKGEVLGGPKNPPKPAKEQQDEAALGLREYRAAQLAFLASKKTEEDKAKLNEAFAKYKTLLTLYHSQIYGGRRRKTRGGKSRRRSTRRAARASRTRPTR
jgi:hypothetical protein